MIDSPVISGLPGLPAGGLLYLKQSPFPADAQIQQINKIQHINYTEHQVIFHPVLFDFFANHDANIRDNCCGEK